jgi:TrmH family RNA methyltransferase
VVVITSLQNQKVKDLVALRERRRRKQMGLMLVDGHDELALALEAGARPVELFVCPALVRPGHGDLARAARAAGATVVEMDERAFRKAAYREHPDGWLATFALPRRRLDDLRLGAVPLLVVAEAVEKPGNLGALLRTADAAGVDAVVSCEPHTDWGNPNVIRASKGTLFTVQTAEAESAQAIAWLKAKGIAIAVGTPEAPAAYTSADFRQPIAIVVGTEREGVSRAWRDAADAAVAIPMAGRVNSLNVATAAALLIYEAVRQRSASRSVRPYNGRG